jgi:hypothetical protein
VKYAILSIIVVIILFLLYLKFSGSVLLGDTILIPRKAKITFTGKNVFTYDVLFADSPKNKTIDKGEVSEQQFSDMFDNFPWAEQIELSNKLQVQSATLSLHDQQYGTTLFISPSIVSEKGEIGFLLGIINHQAGNNRDSSILNETYEINKIHFLIKKFFNRDTNVGDYLRTIK